MLKSHLNTADLYHKKVFIRADLNVPLSNGFIEDDFLLKQLQPTLDIAREKNAYIILGTHIGQPNGQENVRLSTRPLVDWLDNQGYKVSFARTLNHAQEVVKTLCPGSIMVLENLRFYKGEKEYNDSFAQQIYNLAPDYYINDAFSLLNTHDTSVALLPKLYSEDQRSIGFLIERELYELSRIKDNPAKPFVVIISGSTHIREKLAFLDSIIDKISTLLLGPEIVFTFLKAENKPIGKFKVPKNNSQQAQEILNKAEKHKVKVLYPQDYLVAIDSRDGKLCYKNADQLADNDISISVGPKTIEEYKKEIVIRNNANTVLLYGAMGFLKKPETTKELSLLLNIIAQSDAYSMVGGGDSIAAVNKLDIKPQFNTLLTGDTAALAYLNDIHLPGLISLT